MTKRLVFKIDTPWGGKGTLVPAFTLLDPKANPENYHDLFELVEEKSDEEKLADWLFNEVKKSTIGPDEFLAFISKKIISAGFDVKKLVVK